MQQRKGIGDAIKNIEQAMLGSKLRHDRKYMKRFQDMKLLFNQLQQALDDQSYDNFVAYLNYTAGLRQQFQSTSNFRSPETTMVKDNIFGSQAATKIEISTFSDQFDIKRFLQQKYKHSSNTDGDYKEIGKSGFILIHNIGKGGFGKVHLGVSTKNLSEVALKFVDKNQSNMIDDSEWNNFIESEIKALERLNHANIVNLLGFNLNAFNNSENTVMLIFEYAPFGDMFNLLTKCKYLNFKIVKTYLSQILSALKYCHNMSPSPIVHRDIKPANLLFDKYFNIIIADFGLCKIEDKLRNETKYVQIGTPGYMAPEVAAPPEDCDEMKDDEISNVVSSACDIFSLGIVLWQMINGIYQSPFKHPQDVKYEYLRYNQELFWICQSSCRMMKFNSNLIDLKDLFVQMFKFNPNKRITASAIEKHKWYLSINGYNLNNSASDRIQFRNTMSNIYFGSIKHKNVINRPSTAISIKMHKKQSTRVNSLLQSNMKRNNSKSVYPEKVPAWRVKKGLVAIVGIGEYDNFLPNITNSVLRDYKTVIETFNFDYGYHVVYATHQTENTNNDNAYDNCNDNKTSHHDQDDSKTSLAYLLEKYNKMDEINTDFKLKWTYDDIGSFNDQLLHFVDTQLTQHQCKYDSLIYILSGHGFSNQLFYCSNGEEYSMTFTIAEFWNGACRALRNKPKLFIMDTDRGDARVQQRITTILKKKSSHTKKSTDHRATINTTNLDDVKSDDNDSTLEQTSVIYDTNNKLFKRTPIYVQQSHIMSVFSQNCQSIPKNVNNIGGLLIHSITKVLKSQLQLSSLQNNTQAAMTPTFDDILAQARVYLNRLFESRLNIDSVAIFDHKTLPYQLKFLPNRTTASLLNTPATINISQSETSPTHLNGTVPNAFVFPVSKKVESIQMQNPLIAMIAIGDYDGNVALSLEATVTDYKNVIEAFNIVRGYSMIYCTKSNQFKYMSGNTMSKNTLDKMNFDKNDFKIHWLSQDIIKYNKAVMKILQNENKYKYNHDGLIYFISGHSNTSNVIEVSNGDEFPLIKIFEHFHSDKLKHFIHRPKLFVIEVCRGQQTMHPKVDSSKPILQAVKEHENKQDAIDHSQYKSKISANDSKEKSITINSTVTTTNATSNSDDTNSNVNADTIDNSMNYFNYNYNYTSSILDQIYNYSNKQSYSRYIYATLEGFTALEPSMSAGGLLILSFCQSIKCDKYFNNYDLNEILIQTRKIMQNKLDMPMAARSIDINTNMFDKSKAKAKTKTKKQKVPIQVMDDRNGISKPVEFAPKQK